MTDLIGEYCTWYHAYNQISTDRAKQQEKLLRQLEDALEGSIASVRARDVDQFLASREVAASTTLKHLKMLRPFFKWMYRQQHITAEQRIELGELKAPRGANWSEPKPYSRREIAEFWEHVDVAFPWTTDTDFRNQTAYRAEFWVRRWQRNASSWRRVYPYARRLQTEAIVALALFGGLRRIEILNLTLEDMHYENAYVRVTGAKKNPRGEAVVRAVPMTAQLKLALANWIEFRAQVLKPEHDRPLLCLWQERYLEPMKLGALAHLLDKVGDGYELHRMRHTFATERLRAGMPVETLQKIMGHSDISMTLRYARIGVEDVIRVADQTNDDFMAAVVRSHV